MLLPDSLRNLRHRESSRSFHPDYKKHGTTTYGEGIVDNYSSAPSFEHWHTAPRVAVPLEENLHPPPWRPAAARTWLLDRGWKDYYGPLNTSERPA